MKEENWQTCCICRNKFIGYGHNADPVVNGGICCDVCNSTKVIPVRLRILESRRSTENV